MVHDPKQCKYAQKVVGSINRHFRGKRYSNFPDDEAFLVDEHCKQSPEHCNKVADQEQVSDATFDSGVAFRDETPKTFPKKKLSFSDDNEIIEVNMDHHQPKYYDIPQKYIARLSETPKPQKVDIKLIHSSTPQQKTAEITNEVLQAANLIRDHPTERVLDFSVEDKTFVRSPSCRSVDDKFVVNLFESRQSKRWKRRGVCLPNDALQSFIDTTPQSIDSPPKEESHKTDYSEAWMEEKVLDDSEMFQKLKKERDMECVKMAQASNALKMMRKKRKTEWSDELLAEQILLETDEKYTLLVNKIRDLGYTEVISPKPYHTANITLSNFEFLLEPQEYKQNKYSDFYVLSLSHGTTLLMSKVTSPDNNKIIFNEQFTFTNMNSDFNIVMKIFTIKLRTCERTICSLLKKKSTNFCPMSKIYYENVNTYEMEASAVLKPSFNCCGKLILTKDQLGSSRFILSNIPEDSKLFPDATFSLQTSDLRIHSKASCFLTLGLRNKENDIIYWERHWCVLNGTKFSIYNYPSEEDFGESIFSIDLEYCLTLDSTNFKGCPRKRTFLLKAGRPAAVNEANNPALRKKSNFVVEKFYFTTDDSADFQFWTNELQSILNCLRDWRKLIFLDDYY